MQLKLWTATKRLDVFATALPNREWFAFWLRPMQTVSIKQVPDSFTLLLLQRTCSFLGPMSPTLSPKPHPLSRDFSSDQTVLSMSDVCTIKSYLQSFPVMPSQFSRLCRDTLNRHASGKNMPTRFFDTLDSHQQFMNHASIRVIFTVKGSCLCAKLTILLLLHPTLKRLTSLWT